MCPPRKMCIFNNFKIDFLFFVHFLCDFSYKVYSERIVHLDLKVYFYPRILSI